MIRRFRTPLAFAALLSLGLAAGLFYRARAQQLPVASSSKEEPARNGHLAKIDPEQAIAAARSRVPGEARGAELEKEDGHLVYSVVVAPAQGGTQEVKVDPGTGAVLSVEADDSQEEQDDDGD